MPAANTSASDKSNLSKSIEGTTTLREFLAMGEGKPTAFYHCPSLALQYLAERNEQIHRTEKALRS